MERPQLSPVSDRQPSGAVEASSLCDDVDLAPLSEFPAESSGSFDRARGHGLAVGKQPQVLRRWVSAIGTSVLLLVGSWLVWQAFPTTEHDHPNWNHVAAATEASERAGQDLLAFVDSAGAMVIKRDFDAAALNITGNPDRQPSSDQLAGPMATPQQQRNSQQLLLFVFDSCDEDGDIVELLVNGRLVTSVQLTHAGRQVAVPLEPGPNTVTLRGARDGRGGITVGLRTDRGNYFCRVMREGQAVHMVVAPR